MNRYWRVERWLKRRGRYVIVRHAVWAADRNEACYKTASNGADPALRIYPLAPGTRLKRSEMR